MRAVDTNVLVRIISQDNEEQARTALAFIQSGAWVSSHVLLESMWVMGNLFERTPQQLIGILEVLLQHEHLTLQDSETVAAALVLFRAKPALGFADCIILETARKAGHLPLGTFDQRLAKIDGAQKL